MALFIQRYFRTVWKQAKRTEARHVAIACRAACHQVGLSGVEPLTSRLSAKPELWGLVEPSW
jgi:hypothetical protein